MPRNRTQRQVTTRDHEILAALDLAPLAADQLLKLSATWQAPFRSSRLLRERLQCLSEAGLVRRFRYATTLACQPTNYYVQSPAGYELVHGAGERPPVRSYCAEVGLSRQPHTRSLADVLVHTLVATHKAGLSVQHVYRENTLRIGDESEPLWPDAAFELLLPDGRGFRYFVEVDSATERLRSDRPIDSIERKIRRYEAHQERSPERFRVLFLVARAGHIRVKNILATAAAVTGAPQRSLIYATTVSDYLASDDPLTRAVFFDHRGRRQAMLDSRAMAARPPLTALLQAQAA